MARFKDRQKAIELRELGKTYTEIRKELNISKSTLSDWLSKYPLENKVLVILQKKKEHSRQLAIEKTRIVKKKKREARLKSMYVYERKYWRRISKRELEIAGLFLYWGEGNKRVNGSVSLNNTDPAVMKFTFYWIINSLKVSKDKIKVDLHLYKDMDIKKEMEYWSRELKIPLSQFRKPYIKKSVRADIDQKGFGHGTCTLVVNDVRLKEKIMMGIKSIADFYGEKI